MNRPLHRVHTPRRRLLLGVVLLVVGVCLLVDNLGFDISRYLWDYWPFLLIAVGGIQLAWPGTWEERRSGFWLLIVGIWGAINSFEWLGLHWGNSWPIFIIALGIRVLIDGLARSRNSASPPTSGPTQ